MSNIPDVRKMRDGIVRTANVAILPKSGTSVNLMGVDREEFLDKYTSPTPVYVERMGYDESIRIGEFEIYPNGPNNLFPNDFKTMIDKSNILHGVLRQKIDMLMAGGTFLYEEKIDNKIIIHEPVEDAEVKDWLEAMDYEDYLDKQTTNMIYIENNACQLTSNRFRRLNSFKDERKIAKIEEIPIEDARLSPIKNRKSQYLFEADWWNPKEIKRYYMFDKRDPFRYSTSAMFIKMPTFGSKYYGRPPYIGVANYVELAFLILNHQVDALVNGKFRWHVETSFEFWDRVFQDKGVAAGSKEAKAIEDEFLETIDSILYSSTAQNANIRLHTKYGVDIQGKERGAVKITALPDNTEKLGKAYVPLLEKINEGIIAGVHLDPALSNIQIKGTLSSGLDKMVASNMHQLFTAPTPRRLVLKPFNDAIKINWPKKKVKLGFKSIILDTEGVPATPIVNQIVPEKNTISEE